MSIRVSLLAAVAVLGLGSVAPVSAQPQVPARPRYTQFQSVFGAGRPLLVNPGQGFLGQNAPGFINPNNPNGPQFLYPGQTAFPQALPGAYGAINPNLTTTGIVGSFNNLGHWYGGRSGYYGHWYPNGVASGAGVLGSNGAVGVYGGNLGMTGGAVRPATSSVLGTALMGAATVNQFRR